jgi:hypothetical protein
MQKDTQNKMKEQKSFDWRKKKNKENIKRYLLLKCKIIKKLLFEKEEQIKEEGPNPYTLV